MIGEESNHQDNRWEAILRMHCENLGKDFSAGTDYVIVSSEQLLLSVRVRFVLKEQLYLTQ